MKHSHNHSKFYFSFILANIQHLSMNEGKCECKLSYMSPNNVGSKSRCTTIEKSKRTISQFML